MSRTIEIVITREGKTTVQTLGFTGSSCLDGSKFIEQALGASVTEHLTGEFHQAMQSDCRQSQRQ